MSNLNPEHFIGVQPTVFESSLHDNIKQNRDPSLMNHSMNVKEILHQFSHELQEEAVSLINHEPGFTQKHIEDFWHKSAATIDQYENTQNSIQNFIQQQKQEPDSGQTKQQKSEINEYNVNAQDEWI